MSESEFIDGVYVGKEVKEKIEKMSEPEKKQLSDGHTVYEITHPINMDWKEYIRLQQENAKLQSALDEQCRLLGISGSKELKLITENEHLKQVMRHIMSAAGLPDAGDSCRTIIALAKQAIQGDSPDGK